MGIDKATEMSPTTAYAATPADLAETQRLVEAGGGRLIAVTLAICDLGAVGSGPSKRYPRYRKLLVGLRRQFF
jgi:hypothetical protein